MMKKGSGLPRSQLFPIIRGGDTHGGMGLAEAATTCRPLRLGCKRPPSCHRPPCLTASDLHLPPQHCIFFLLLFLPSLSLHSAVILNLLLLLLHLRHPLLPLSQALLHLVSQSLPTALLLPLSSLSADAWSHPPPSAALFISALR